MRGTQGTADEMSAEADIYDVEYALPPGGACAALRLRLLSLRCGDPYVCADAGETLALHALEFAFSPPAAEKAENAAQVRSPSGAKPRKAAAPSSDVERP